MADNNSSSDSKRPAKQPAKRSTVKKKASPRKKKSLAAKDKEELQTLRKILKRSHQHDSVGHAVSIMQENLNSYIILGYSFNGDPITAVSASTPQEYDALYSRAVQFVQQQGTPKSGGEPPSSE
jgi:hypothetical protein